MALASRFDRVPRALWDAAGLALLFVTAFLIRLTPVLRGGGLHFYGRYDDGVYYAAAESLSFGHLPYRNFVLLHPPGGILALVPFALVGRLTSDPTGLALARLAVMALGALNTVLVAVIASRWGRPQAALAGLLYACSAAAVYAEQTTFLEPVGTTLTLVALLALTRRGGRHDVRLEILAGVGLGLGCSVKIWYVAPLAAIVLVLALERAWRPVVRLCAAAAVSAAAVLVPFFALAPQQMWRMVVSDQLGRTGASMPAWTRLNNLLGSRFVFGAGTTLAGVATAALLVALLLAALLCISDRAARPVLAMAVVDLGTLLSGPSYFRHYGIFAAGSFAVVLAVGLGRAVGALPRGSVRSGLVVGLGVAVLASGLKVAHEPTGRRFPAARFAAAAPPGCIAADDPAALIQMNRLTTDLAAGCRVPVDVTGNSYGSGTSRRQNAAFHAWLTDYLTDSAAFTLLRVRRDAFTPEQKTQIRTYRPIARAEGLTLRRGRG